MVSHCSVLPSSSVDAAAQDHCNDHSRELRGTTDVTIYTSVEDSSYTVDPTARTHTHTHVYEYVHLLAG